MDDGVAAKVLRTSEDAVDGHEDALRVGLGERIPVDIDLISLNCSDYFRALVSLRYFT